MKTRMRSIDRIWRPSIPNPGPSFLTDPRRGCAPEKIDDPDMFFSESGKRQEEAILICQECTFRRRCDAYATEHKEKWGVWGGKSRDPDVQVKELWDRGISDKDIAARLGRTMKAVFLSRARQGLWRPDEGVGEEQLGVQEL
jgi:hypothetical protein